ncbi:thioredoxin domain-containing protein [Variovorax sp. J22P240]|uniref:DsbA family protein n=1 Tax=Variovorax sp. J22P240 TaxID=3053514 RepID=UPI002578828A|nr:thioredoxin domain-containing protein [Variovorax sp. J22P240]MDL9997403.1 thioredoxin domain-containing protein [Variovorax sp. J22P240]
MNTRTSLSPLLVPDMRTDHIVGSGASQVTVVEYGDFECPSCRQAHPAVKILLAHFGDKVCYVFRHYPLREVHPHAELAAEASEAASAQHKFWPYHDLLFTHQQHLDKPHLFEFGEQLGLDMSRFRNEVEDHVYLQRVQEQVDSGRRVGVRSTPAFYVDGVGTDVTFGLQHLQEAVDKALLASAA